MKKTTYLLTLMLFLLGSACQSDKPDTTLSSVNKKETISSTEEKEASNYTYVIFCDYPQHINEPIAQSESSHALQLYNRIEPICQLINKHMSKKENRSTPYSIKVYPLYDYTSNGDLMGQYICETYKEGDLTSRVRARKCKKSLRESFKAFTKKTTSSGRIRIINSMKVLKFLGHQVTDEDATQIFYVSNLIERIYPPDRAKCEFNFVDENNYLDPLSVNAAAHQLKDNTAPLSKLVEDLDIKGSEIEGSQVQIIQLRDYQVQNQAGVSMNDVRTFWLDFFTANGLKAKFYDSVKEVRL